MDLMNWKNLFEEQKLRLAGYGWTGIVQRRSVVSVGGDPVNAPIYGQPQHTLDEWVIKMKSVSDHHRECHLVDILINLVLKLTSSSVYFVGEPYGRNYECTHPYNTPCCVNDTFTVVISTYSKDVGHLNPVHHKELKEMHYTPAAHYPADNRHLWEDMRRNWNTPRKVGA